MRRRVRRSSPPSAGTKSREARRKRRPRDARRHADLMLRLGVFVTIWPAWPGRGDVGWARQSWCARERRGAHRGVRSAFRARECTRTQQARGTAGAARILRPAPVVARARPCGGGRPSNARRRRPRTRVKMKKPVLLPSYGGKIPDTYSQIAPRVPGSRSASRPSRRATVAIAGASRVLFGSDFAPPCARPWGERPRRPPPRTPPLRHRATRGEGRSANARRRRNASVSASPSRRNVGSARTIPNASA